MILVIDDNEDSLRIVQKILENNGFEVEAQRTAKDGLARAREKLPELIVLDIMMPDVSGVEALAELRASPQTSRVPVILLTAKSDDADVINGYQVGADYYMTKPFTAKQLLYGIRLVLGREPAAS
jgi:DNA-binding response OmpR family regulator